MFFIFNFHDFTFQFEGFAHCEVIIFVELLLQPAVLVFQLIDPLLILARSVVSGGQAGLEEWQVDHAFVSAHELEVFVLSLGLTAHKESIQVL